MKYVILQIILLTRDEDQWMESWKRQYAKNTTDLYRNYFIGWLSPSAWKMGRFNELNGSLIICSSSLAHHA